MKQSEERPLFCPTCGARYMARAEVLDEGLWVLCGLCGSVNKSADAVVSKTRPEVDPGVIVEATWPRVVVGHEQPAACRTLSAVLRRGGYAPVCVRRGEQVLQAVDPSLPAPAVAVVMDVAVPGVMAFEVAEQLRSMPNMEALPIVLLASVFERTRYKRRPNRLYGADAYLELHHVPDRLVEVLDALRAGTSPGQDRHQAPSDRAEAAPLRARIDPISTDARRAYARRLLSDVALYHGDEIAKGIRDGQPLRELQAAIDEARSRFLHDTAILPSEGTPLFDDEVAQFGDRLTTRGPARPAE